MVLVLGGMAASGGIPSLNAPIISQLGLFMEMRSQFHYNYAFVFLVDWQCRCYLDHQVYNEALDRLIRRIAEVGQLRRGALHVPIPSQGFARDLVAPPEQTPEGVRTVVQTNLFRDCRG